MCTEDHLGTQKGVEILSSFRLDVYSLSRHCSYLAQRSSMFTVVGKPVATFIVTIAKHTNNARPASEEENTAGDAEVHEKEDQGKVCPVTPPEAEGDEEGAAQALQFGGFNKEGKPMSEAGEVLEVSEDYVTKEYTEVILLRRRRLLRLVGHSYEARCYVTLPSKVIKYLFALFILSASQGWGEPSPDDTNWLFDLKSSPKQNRSGYLYFSHFKEKLLTSTTDTEALKKRSGDSFAQTPLPKRPKGNKVNDHLVGADEMFVELLMGGLLKEETRMDYTYSRTKSSALKNITTTTNLQTEVDLAKKEVEEVRVELDEDKSTLEEDIKSRQAKEEALLNKVESLESAALLCPAAWLPQIPSCTSDMSCATSSFVTHLSNGTEKPLSYIPPSSMMYRAALLIVLRALFLSFGSSLVLSPAMRASHSTLLLEAFNLNLTTPFKRCPPGVTRAIPAPKSLSLANPSTCNFQVVRSSVFSTKGSCTGPGFSLMLLSSFGVHSTTKSAKACLLTAVRD
uniref:Uncharacterized protein n=1 Tax=Cannabis sativa TaxID=3483 RepID=A0A803P9D3_CANSA